MYLRETDEIIVDKENNKIHFVRNLQKQCKFELSYVKTYNKRWEWAKWIPMHERSNPPKNKCPYCFKGVYYR